MVFTRTSSYHNDDDILCTNLSHWGIEKEVIHAAKQPHTAELPSDIEPPPPNGTLAKKYSWDKIGYLNDINVRTLRRELAGKRPFAAIDSTRALSRRFDCRADFLHFSVPGVLTHSWFRMFQSALYAMGRWGFEGEV